MVADHEALNEIEAHRRELKAVYDAVTDVLRVIEDLQLAAGRELMRWDRKVDRHRAETAIDEHQRLAQLEAERDAHLVTS